MISIEQALEFSTIKERLSGYAYTQAAKEKIMELTPLLSESKVASAQKETGEARLILDKIGNPPLTSLDGVRELMNIAEKGGCLTPEQLEYSASILTTVKRMKDFLNRAKQLEIGLPYYEENMDSMDEVRDEIHHAIRGKSVNDSATKELKSIRIEIERTESKMREKADSVLKANKGVMSDNFCTIRNGRVCLPVKKEYKFKISGSVIDCSSTGNTLFIEPTAVAKYAEQLTLLKLEEENEIRKILYTLTGMVADAADVFTQNKKTMEKLDFMFAKGKLSAEYGGTEPMITSERKIKIQNGRHPLMDQKTCVPLNFAMGDGISGVIITGPNTGGKTVAIKTVGLNCLMAQCGLHVSCEKAEICLNNQILCAIGDGQNIAQNLSTFSAHIKNVLNILSRAGKESLVIIDELGSGTDPTEGMGIAISILEELKRSGALHLITTHYPEVKNYAEQTKGVVNARMTFDRESLKPLYQLEVGKAGESCALYIAKKLGMPGRMLACANKAAYGIIKQEFSDADETQGIVRKHTAGLEKNKSYANRQSEAEQFQLGDSVLVYPDKKIGIVCQTVNEKGVLRVQMPGKKIWINHKRVKLHVAASELYPPDYDFSIIFDTVENRKARHSMERKHESNLEIEINETNYL